MSESNNNLSLLIAFIGGVAVGANWDKIKKQAGPYMGIAKRFLADQKDKIEEILQEEKAKAPSKRKK